MSATKILWGPILTVLFIVLAALWGATQWAAWQLGFQPQLGEPWFVVGATPVYPPPAIVWWWFFFDAYAPDVFMTSGIIAASGGFLAIAFATNDERTAKRLSDTLGTATEMRAMKNYAGHRLSPWLGHLMVSRQETARALLTPGEVMQLPPTDEIVLVSGLFPIRAKKARYFEDRRLSERVLPPPKVSSAVTGNGGSDDWTGRVAAAPPEPPVPSVGAALLATLEDSDTANSGIRKEPELPEHEDIDPPKAPVNEFDLPEDDPDDEAIRVRTMRRRMLGVARQVSLDPDDGLEL